MKKYFSLLVCCLLLSTFSLAGECFYVRAAGGISHLHDRIDDFNTKYDNGFAVSAAVGTPLFLCLKWEVEGLFLRNRIKDITIDDDASTGLKGHVQESAVLCNILFAPSIFSGFEPYVGVGGGYGVESVRLTADTMPNPVKDKEKRLVYQAIAGMAVRVWNPCCGELWMTFDGRYFVFDKHVRAIVGLAGMQYRF